MVRPEGIFIERHMTVEELDKQIKLEKNATLLKRLYFIKYRYGELSVEESIQRIGSSKQTGYTWQERWNQDGYDGLKPRYSGGRRSKLADKQKEQLKIMLTKRDDWTTEAVRELIFKEFDVKYSLKQVRVILHNFGMKLAKPYSHDYRRPDDAEEQLKKKSRRWMMTQ